MAERLARFDADGDGVLSDEEKILAREEFKKRGERAAWSDRKHHNRVKRFDVDGDGVLSEEEKAAARAFREERHAEILSRFDTDGDGVLSVEEREAARASRRAGGQKTDTDVK